MDILYDYQPADPALAVANELRVLQQLQSCFQQALGHELPNRLVAVQGLARLLLLEQAERLDEEGRGYLERLAGAARQADEMVRALAELGRLLRDPGPLEDLDLGEMVREALAEVTVLYPGRLIEYHLADSFPALKMPRRPWQQVLSQLCRYLVESTPAASPCRLAIAGQARGDTVEVSVADQTSRTEAELKQPMEPFTGGIGLGKGLNLFPARMIVAGWGGRFAVQSLPGQGTRFVLGVRAGSHRNQSS